MLNEKHEKLSEKHRALSEQFTEKNRMLKHIADSLPIMRLGGIWQLFKKRKQNA